MADTPMTPPTSNDGGSGLPVTPVQQTPMAATPASTTPAPAPAAAPVAPGPATAPASTLPPSTSSGTHGVLANIALGALSGAAVALKKVGQLARNQAMNSPEGQKIRAANLAQQEGQQRMQLAEKKSEEESTAAMDEHQVKQLNIQDMNMDHIHKIAENAHIESLYAGEEETQRNALMKMHQEQDTVDRALLANLESMGIHITPKPLSEFTPADAKNVGPHAEGQGGQQLVISNGKTGKEAGGGFISNAELEATVLPSDIKTISDWNFDPKTGAMTPVYKTLVAGQNSAMDVVIAHDAGMDKFNQLQGQYTKQLADAKTKADIAESQGKTVQEYAEAEKAKAEAKLAVSQTGTGDPTKKGQAYLDSVDPLHKSLMTGLLRYQMKPADLGRSKDRALLIGGVLLGDPNAGTPKEWTEAKYQERYNYLQEYGGSSKGDGATRSRINTAVGHLDLLNQAGQALAQNDIPKINQIANAIGVQMGQSPQLVYDAIAEKAGGEIAGAVKGGGASATDPALEKATANLSSKMSPQQRQDVLSAQAAILQTMVGTIAGKFNETMGSTPDEFGQPVLYGGNDQRLKSILSGGQGNPPAGATHKVPGPDGKNHWTNAQGTVDLGIAQ